MHIMTSLCFLSQKLTVWGKGQIYIPESYFIYGQFELNILFKLPVAGRSFN